MSSEAEKALYPEAPMHTNHPNPDEPILAQCGTIFTACIGDVHGRVHVPGLITNVKDGYFFGGIFYEKPESTNGETKILRAVSSAGTLFRDNIVTVDGVMGPDEIFELYRNNLDPRLRNRPPFVNHLEEFRERALRGPQPVFVQRP